MPGPFLRRNRILAIHCFVSSCLYDVVSLVLDICGISACSLAHLQLAIVLVDLAGYVFQGASWRALLTLQPSSVTNAQH